MSINEIINDFKPLELTKEEYMEIMKEFSTETEEKVQC